MSSRSGPSITSNGLVFSFDMKNTEKSWKGTPTTNLNSALTYTQNWANSGTATWSSNDTTVDRVFSNHPVSSMTITATGNCHIGMGNPSISGTGTFAVSIYCYIPMSAGVLAGSVPYMRTFPANTSRGALAYENSTDWATWPRDQWIRLKGTFTNTANDTSMYISTYLNTVGNKIYLTAPQFESQNFVTPFVDGSRTNTQSVFDIAGTNTITANSLTYTENDGFSFNGTSDYISLPNSLGYTTEFSQFAWFKSSGTPAGGYHIIFGGQEAELSIPTAGQLRIGVFTTARYVGNLSSGLTDGNWHYVGMTYKASEGVIRGYKDGVEVGTVATNSGSPTSSFVRTMGRFGTNTTYYTNGKILLAQIYNRALTAAEVKQNFDAIKSRYPGHFINNPAYTASQIKYVDSTITNGFYWISPPNYSGSPEYVFVDFDGSVSGITDSGPWIRIRYAQDYYTRAAPWTGTGNSSTNPGAYSGDFSFEQNKLWIHSILSNATDVRQRFESWGFGSVGWTYANGEYMGVKAFNGNAYNGSNASNIVKQNKPAGISHGVTDINTFDNPTAQGTDPTDTNDGVWRVGVFYFRDVSDNKILPISGIWNGDVDGTSEQRYFPFRTGESTPGVNSDIWVKLKS